MAKAEDLEDVMELRPSPLAPLPKRERGTRKKLKMTLALLLPLWEKGLGDEGSS